MHTITIESTEPQNTRLYPRWQFYRWSIWRNKKFWIPTLVVVILLAAVGGYGYTRAMAIQAKAKPVMEQAQVLKVAAKDQNLSQLQRGLPELQTRLDALDAEVDSMAYLGHMPWIGNYYQDSQRAFAAAKEGIAGGTVLVNAAMPYADVLGFKTDNTSTGPKKSSEDKIAELVLLMPSILPALDEASTHFSALRGEIDGMDPQRYPEEFRGIKIRSQLTEVKSQVDVLEEGMRQGQPLLKVLPAVLGAESSKKYIILFQNDKELRPTGGFLTSYAYVTFSKGKFTVSDNGDIYQLDRNRSFLPISAPMRTYLGVPQLNMRDTNFSPDFVKSMKDFELYYTKGGNTPIDGIIALDTQFVESLMKITGPLTVKGYKEPFSAKDMLVNGTHVSQVVYQLELIAEKSGGGSDRKGILGDLMQVMIKHVLDEPPTKWPDYVKMLMQQGQEKNVLLYFHDDEAQGLSEKWNFGGRIQETAEGHDYLHVNDANLGGLKSNFYLTQQTKSESTVDADGTVHRKVTITYKNTGKFDGWINATARNYTRVYVPKGSKLVKSTGGEQKVTTSTDLGYTVFDNFVRVPALKTEVMTFEYVLPFKMTDGQYQALIQKQPGAGNWKYTTVVNGQSSELILDGDKQVSMTF